MNVVVHPADVQDRDGAFHLLRRARRLFPFIERIFADGGYAGRKMALTVWRTGAWSLQIVKRSDIAGFEVLPKRWIVERTFAWISRNRRLARDFERYTTTVAAFIRLAMIRIMLRRLAAKPLAMNPNFPDGLLGILPGGYGGDEDVWVHRCPKARSLSPTLRPIFCRFPPEQISDLGKRIPGVQVMDIDHRRRYLTS